jgi:hypothetical protein
MINFIDKHFKVIVILLLLVLVSLSLAILMLVIDQSEMIPGIRNNLRLLLLDSGFELQDLFN